MASDDGTAFEVNSQQVSQEEKGVAAVVTSSGLSGDLEHYPRLHDCSVKRLSSRETFKSYFDGVLEKLQRSVRHTQSSVSRQEKCMEELEMKVLSLGQQTVGLSESLLGQMETSVNDHDNQMDSLENSVSGNTDRIDSLENLVSGNTDRMDSLENSVTGNMDQMEASVSENRDRISSMEASIQSLLGCKDLSKKLQSTDNIRTQLEGLSASMDSTHEHLLCSLDSLEGRLANLESSVTTMTERVESVML